MNNKEKYFLVKQASWSVILPNLLRATGRALKSPWTMWPGIIGTGIGNSVLNREKEQLEDEVKGWQDAYHQHGDAHGEAVRELKELKDKYKWMDKVPTVNPNWGKIKEDVGDFFGRPRQGSDIPLEGFKDEDIPLSY